MIPLLYKESVLENPEALADPNYNGYGFFDTCKSCKVTEERNGEYTLAMSITINDRLADVVVPNMLVKAKANPLDNPQLFEIYEVSEDGANINIKANHISYLFQNDIINRTRQYEATGNDRFLRLSKTFGEDSVETIIDDLFNSGYLYFGTPNPTRKIFSFTSDILTPQVFSWHTHNGNTVGKFMKGIEGSLVDVFGGEYKYDNFSIQLKEQRGSSTDKIIRYGANLGKYTKSMSSDNTYTHVCCYAKVHDDGAEDEVVIIGKPYQIVTNTLFEKVKMVDVTSLLKDMWEYVRTTTAYPFRNPVTLEAMREIAEQYKSPTVYSTSEGSWGYDRVWAFCTMVAGQPWRVPRPSTEIEVTITIDYSPALDELQECNLCDSVKVMLRNNDIVTSKIIKVVYDSINEKYTSMSVGSKKLTLTDFFTKKRR